jgi:hypothetical protein
MLPTTLIALTGGAAFIRVETSVRVACRMDEPWEAFYVSARELKAGRS